jgi:hypothetical protein
MKKLTFNGKNGTDFKLVLAYFWVKPAKHKLNPASSRVEAEFFFNHQPGCQTWLMSAEGNQFQPSLAGG